MSRDLTPEDLDRWKKVSKDYTLVDQFLPTINDLVKQIEEADSDVGLQ
jgi:hypothetical protein